MAARTCGWILALAAVLSLASVARADIPPQPAPKSVTAPVKVVRGRGEGSKLQIPKQVLAQLAADLERQQAGLPTRTVVAGVAMSLAAVSSLLLLRRGRSKAVAAAVLCAGSVFAATAFADLAPPRKENPKHQIKIEVLEQGDTIVIELGKDLR